jgi:hypothetical protein
LRRCYNPDYRNGSAARTSATCLDIIQDYVSRREWLTSSPGAAPRWAGLKRQAPRAPHAKLGGSRTSCAASIKRRASCAAPILPPREVSFTRRSFVQLLRKTPPTPRRRNGGGLFLLAAKEETVQEEVSSGSGVDAESVRGWRDSSSRRVRSSSSVRRFSSGRTI